MRVIGIAMVCHEANRAYCQTLGDNSLLPWEEAPEWQRESSIQGVQFRLDNPGCGSIEMHNSWMEEKIRQGWVHGEVKNPETKEHPCLVPYEQLPPAQKAKDSLFASIVDSLKPLLGE